MKLASALVVAVSVGLQVGAAAGPALTPAEVLAGIARGAEREVQFQEVRAARLLKTPIRSNGVLRFIRPDRLERETLQPVHETVVIEGAEITIDRAGAQTSVSLSSGSPPAMMVQTLRAVLSGDWRELELMNRVQATGSISEWMLLLEPRADSAMIREIRLSGHNDTVDEIAVIERNGDSTITRLLR
jgi:hypothetical protein